MADCSEHPRVSSVRFDQCQLGQKNSDGLPVKKPTELVHSDGNLVYYFQDLRCGRFPKRCNGKHAQLTGKEAHAARIWPWDLARRLAWGIVRMMKRKHWHCSHPNGGTHYPTIPIDEMNCIAGRQKYAT
mgnify:CR=1 FL=1